MKILSAVKQVFLLIIFLSSCRLAFGEDKYSFEKSVEAAAYRLSKKLSGRMNKRKPIIVAGVRNTKSGKIHPFSPFFQELMSYILQRNTYKILDRTKIDEAQKKLKFSSSAFFDPKKAKRFGRQVKTNILLLGEIQEFENQWKISFRVVNTRNHYQVAATRIKVNVDERMKRFLEQEKLARKKKPKTKKIRIEKDFVLIPGGCYSMGDTLLEGDSDEQPVHKVCVQDFYLGKYEVTQKLWKKIMKKNPSSFQKGDLYPVENVSWKEVQTFLQKLNQKTGKKYRLPTEEEWEYACASKGKEKYRYGNHMNRTRTSAMNFHFSHNQTTPVGSFLPNRWGLYDMSGNVWEWVQDGYSENAYKQREKNNPTKINPAGSHVIRGGGWANDPFRIRCANRGSYESSGKDNDLGFRLARNK